MATAVVAAIDNGAAFGKERDFAAWFGIVPRQCSTGSKARLFGIRKLGTVYLRQKLTHGARAAVLRVLSGTVHLSVCGWTDWMPISQEPRGGRHA